MQLKLESPKIFSDLVSIISDLVTEVRLKVTKEGLIVTAIDPANIAMVHFKIPSELFSQYNLDDKDEVLGINLDNLKAVLRRCGLGGSLTISKEDNMLKLSILDKIKRDFSLALIDIESEEKDIPLWEFSSVIKMDSNSFSEVIEDCAIVSDASTFIAETNKFIIEARGLNSARAEFSSDEVEIYSENATARFSLEYLNKFIKGAKISSRVTISFSSNSPMRIDYYTGNVLLSFALAPRVEQED